MKGLNYIVVVFFVFVLLANVCYIMQTIYFMCIGKLVFNKKIFKKEKIIKDLKKWYKKL